MGDSGSFDEEFSHLTISKNSSIEKLAEIYVREVGAWHGVPASIVSERDVRFASRF